MPSKVGVELALIKPEGIMFCEAFLWVVEWTLDELNHGSIQVIFTIMICVVHP